MNRVPVRPFSGRPPSRGGLNVGSRQVPVHTPEESVSVSLYVSLYETRVRSAVLEPTMLFPRRVFQNMSLPVRKARLTPCDRAASTLARCWPDQYSSWPAV